MMMQSALTGESLPVTKMTGDVVFSGSICKQGEIQAVVIATGIHSFFGKAALLVDSTEVVGHFQKVSTTKTMEIIYCYSSESVSSLICHNRWHWGGYVKCSICKSSCSPIYLLVKYDNCNFLNQTISLCSLVAQNKLECVSYGTKIPRDD